MEKNFKKTKCRLGIAVSQFNAFITERLLDGCLEELRRRGLGSENLKIVWAPGAFELPLVAQKLCQRRDIDAVIALGAVIRGETYHFELVCRAAQEGLLAVGLKSGKPVVFGVITTNTVRQAYARSQKKGKNKGRDAATAALQMVETLCSI